MATVSNKLLVAGGLLWSIVLAGCVSQHEYDQLEAQNAQLRQEVSAQSAEIADNQAQVTRLQGAIKYTIESDLVFAPGSWEITAEGKEIIAKMAAKLAPSQQNRIVVHGYTDNEPVGPELERQGVTSNQILSERRAEAVKQFLISQGMAPDLVIAVGHGEANPVARNDTTKGRSLNRRVELTLGG